MTRRRWFLLVLLGLLPFAWLATLNAAGYRYGVADQAFYVPAVLQDLDPALFPRDGALIASQARLLIFDELFAIVHRTTGVPIPWLFLAGYVTAIGALYAALVSLGTTFCARGWSVAGLVVAGTLRHRIAKTGANTLEGHFHPRMLAFAIGLFALIAVLRRRPLAAVLLVIAAGVLHPTTAIFFAVWIGVALAVNEPARRRPLALAAVAASVIATAVLATGALSLAPMDEAWVRAFEDKDYVFPTAWSAGTWLVNLIYPCVIVGGYAARRRAGVAQPRELGIVAGCLALVALFLASLPFVAYRSAFIVQMQVSRVFWMADLLATVYAIWWIAEGTRGRDDARTSDAVDTSATSDAPVSGGRRDERAHRPPAAGLLAHGRWRAPALAVLLAIVAAARGWYVLRVEHPGRPFAEIDLPDDEWRDVSRWVQAHTPKEAGLLADPGHAWKYGTSLRVSAERDVFLEDVKDASIGFYTRPVAIRVSERRVAAATVGWGDAGPLPAAPVAALASRYDLQYVVTERPIAKDGLFAEAYRNGRFFVYRLTR